MTWRLLPVDEVDPGVSMAVEEAILDTVARTGEPALRCWTWDRPAVTLGRFQSHAVEVDMAACRRAGCTLVRRMTGGGAMFHWPGGELAYSVTAPEGVMPASVVEAYQEVLGRVATGLNRMGLDARLEHDNCIMIGGNKVSGNAQRRSRGVVQVHGTVLWRVDEGLMLSVLRARPGYDTGRATASRQLPVTSVSEHCDASLAETHMAVEAALLDGRDWELGFLTGGEAGRVQELAETRYSSDAWNLSQ